MADPVIGVTFRPQSPPERLRQVAQATEVAGIAQLWLWEDCFFEGGLTAATAALAATERLEVAVGLLPTPLRNPALAAMEIATIARMFPGRFRPGLGHGVQDWMEQVGARVASPMTLLHEYTTAVRALLHGETVTVEGRYVKLRDVRLDWPPADPPPLLVGGRGPRTVRLAGEMSDGLILDGGHPPAEDRALLALAEEAHAAAGRAGEPFDPVVFTEIDTDGDVPALVDEAITTRAAIGAGTVVLIATGTSTDPEPLIAACTHRGRGRAQ